MSTAISTRHTLPELVTLYEQSCASIRSGFRQIASAVDRLGAFTLDGTGIHIRVSNGHSPVNVDERDIDDALLQLRHDLWSIIIDRTEIRRFLSVRRWNDLDEQIRRRTMPEITVQAISDLLGSFTTQFDALLAEAVEEVFDWLRPRGHTDTGQLKTNSELEVPPKVILSHVVERWSTSWRFNCRYDQNFTALENVFSALDGAGQATKTSWSAVATAVRAPGFDGSAETPYFRFKVFRNGRMHLTFKRRDLLAKFNAIAGGRRLRPPTTTNQQQRTA